MPQATVQIADDGTATLVITSWLDPLVAQNLVGAAVTGTTTVAGVQVTFTFVVTPKTKFDPRAKK
jgi:hypothetical protein